MQPTHNIKKIALKIAKCLALASSSNPHEAAAAKRQADSLMLQYNLTIEDVGITQIQEKDTQKIISDSKIPAYLKKLAETLALFFSCDVIYFYGGTRYVTFFGMGHKPELAIYVFDVLRRQINNDRTAYRKKLTRYKPSNKTKLSDIFCDAWVANISRQVGAFAGTQQERQLIRAYIDKAYPSLTYTTRKAVDYSSLASHSVANAQAAGAEAGKKASLYHAVNSTAKQTSLTHKIPTTETRGAE